MRIKIFLTALFLIAAAGAAHSQICFKVDGNGLKSPSWLFGTHHLAPLSVFSDNEGAKSGFESAETVVGETDMESMTDMAVVMQMQQLAVAPADSTLAQLIPTERFAKYESVFAKLSGGMPLKMFDGFKPFVAANIVTLSLISSNLGGFNAEEQLDGWLQSNGKQAGKKVVTLETPMQQAEMLYCAIPVSAQLKSLCELLDNPDKVMEETRSLNEAYLRGDLETLLKLSQEEEDADAAAFNEVILLKRNKEWLSKLPDIMSAAPSFIAVGALHLPGEQSLVEGLRRLGYTVTPQ